MAKNYRDYSYFENRPDVVRIFDELDAYLDWCRLELQPFNPADLYKRDSTTYQNYLSSKRPRRQYQGNKPFNRTRNEQNFSR